MVKRKLNTVMWVSVARVLLLTNIIVAVVGGSSHSVLSDRGTAINVSESLKRLGLRLKQNLSENSTIISPAYTGGNNDNERIEYMSAPENIQNVDENYKQQEQFNLVGQYGDYSEPVQNQNVFRINVPSFSEPRASKLQGQFSSGTNVGSRINQKQLGFVINVPDVNMNFDVELQAGNSIPDPDNSRFYGKHLSSQHEESENFPPIPSGYVETPSSYIIQQNKNSYNYNNAVQKQEDGYLPQQQYQIFENNEGRQTYENQLQQEHVYSHQGTSENAFQQQNHNYKGGYQTPTYDKKQRREQNYAYQSNSENIFQHQGQANNNKQQKQTHDKQKQREHNFAYQGNYENVFQHPGQENKNNRQKQTYDNRKQQEHNLYAYQGNYENVFQHPDKNYKIIQQKEIYDNRQDYDYNYHENSENVFQHQGQKYKANQPKLSLDKEHQQEYNYAYHQGNSENVFQHPPDQYYKANQQKQTYDKQQDYNYPRHGNSENVFQHQDKKYEDNQQKQTYDNQQEQENNYAHQENLKNIFDNPNEQSINTIEKRGKSYLDLKSPLLESGFDNNFRVIKSASPIHFEENQPNIKTIDPFAESQPQLSNERYQYPMENQNMFNQNLKEKRITPTFDQYENSQYNSQMSTSDEIFHNSQYNMATDNLPLNKFEMEKPPYAKQVFLKKLLPPNVIDVPNPYTDLEEKVPNIVKEFIHQPYLPVRENHFVQPRRRTPPSMAKHLSYPVNDQGDAYQPTPFTKEKNLMYVVEVPVVTTDSISGRRPYKVSSVEQPAPSSVSTRFNQGKNDVGVINNGGYGNSSRSWGMQYQNIQNYPLKMPQVNYNNHRINIHHNNKDFDLYSPPVTSFSVPWDKPQPEESVAVLKPAIPYRNNAGGSDYYNDGRTSSWGMQFQNTQNFPLVKSHVNTNNNPQISRYQNSKDFHLIPPMSRFSNPLDASPTEKYSEYVNPKSTYTYDTALPPTFYNSQNTPSTPSRQITMSPSEVQQMLKDLGLKALLERMNDQSNIQSQKPLEESTVKTDEGLSYKNYHMISDTDHNTPHLTRYQNLWEPRS